MKGWRTVIVNVVSAVVACAAGLLEYMSVVDVPPELVIGAIVIVNAGNVYLRSITDSPMGKKI